MDITHEGYHISLGQWTPAGPQAGAPTEREIEEFTEDREAWVNTFVNHRKLQDHLDLMANIWNPDFEAGTTMGAGATSRQGITDFLYRFDRSSHAQVGHRTFVNGESFLFSARLGKDTMNILIVFARVICDFFKDERTKEECAKFKPLGSYYLPQGPRDYMYWLGAVQKIAETNDFNTLTRDMYKHHNGYNLNADFWIQMNKEKLFGIDCDDFLNTRLPRIAQEILDSTFLDNNQKLMCMKGVLIWSFSMYLTRYYALDT